MDPITISYHIKLREDVTEVFDFSLDGETFELDVHEITDPPKWAELGFKQCSHCPLKAEEHTHCPVALQLHRIVSCFDGTRSIDEVALTVVMEERQVVQTVALQRAISSMLGLVFPTCGCPKTEYMRPMARFHLPLANEEETVFRVAGMYLLSQYFLTNNGKTGKLAFDGLVAIYDDLHILNKAIASRLQYATDSDSAKNAITLLDMYSSLVPMLLDDQLVELRKFFKAFLPDDVQQPVAANSNLLEKARAFALDMDADKLALEPVTDGHADNSTPAWMRESTDTGDAKPAATTATPAKPAAPSRIDEILASSSLSLSLEPIAGETPKPAAGAGKAAFSLPED
ncbi:MAG TPA: hypothetical protein PLF22_05365 [Pseudomonadales bacterium]|nr:hypothetical protein [Pseudomonadales bacterium]